MFFRIEIREFHPLSVIMVSPLISALVQYYHLDQLLWPTYPCNFKLPFQVEQLIVKLKKEFPTWGAPKLRERLRTHYGELALPAKSTVHAVLDRHGLVKKKRSRRHPKLSGTPLSDLKEPNALWCVDYKGEFMLGNKQYCYPLTVIGLKTLSMSTTTSDPIKP
jgi:hypothetical protein